MHFTTSVLALIASAALTRAGTVTFRTLDDVKRTIYFTPNEGFPEMQSVEVSNSEETTVEFEEPWIGNYYAIPEGKDNIPGMLGEVNFGGWKGLTYFDVSAIVDPNDKTNVKQMYPKKSKTPMSGCESFPCDNAYYLPDDVQTKVTSEKDLVTTLGDGSAGVDFGKSN